MAVNSTQHYKKRQCPGYADAQLRYKPTRDGMIYLEENISICPGYWEGPPGLPTCPQFYRKVLGLLFSDYHPANSSFEPESIKKRGLLDDDLIIKKMTPRSRLKILSKASTTCSNRMRDLRTEHLVDAQKAKRCLDFGNGQSPPDQLTTAADTDDLASE
ncbi:hypothetical protein QAD02_012942 [Eretmocerus hayati]|uniref:Uncharacterized protein n=1 Tax=Eretmocerus hayati TaxID=131215 RepID=A0ACC2P0R2_9HYME|nr:hypothetical protein QAD02_012942 [Eretmocerus hayati]